MSSVEENTLLDGWQEKKLGEICKKITKGTTPTSLGFSFVEKGINFLKIENINNDSIDESSIHKFINSEAHLALKRSQLIEGDVLFSIAGTIGSVAKVNSSVLPANTNQALAILRGYEDFLKFEYLYFFLKYISENVEKQHARGGALKNISLTDIKNTEIKYPPLEEQKRIVAKIDTLFAKIDKAISLTEESLKQAKNLLPSVLKEVFKKFESEIKQQKLKDVCELITDGAHYSPKTVDEGYPYVTVRDVSWNGDIDLIGCANISEEDFQDLKRGNCSPMNGDILYSKDGTVGKIALVNEEKEFVVLSSLAIIRPTSMINPKFLMYSMMSPKFYDFALSSKTGAAIKRIVLKTIKEFEVSIPDIQSQLSSIKFLDKIVCSSKETQSKLEEQLAYLKQLKASILSKAFKGEL